MIWVEAFVVLGLSHLAGDFILQTDWQATHKFGGLSGGEAGRALFSHIATYALAMVPALVWIGVEESVGAALVIAAAVLVPHLIQDDGRLLRGYMRRIKRNDAAPGDLLFMLVDQSFHLLALFGAALLAVA